jgi:hypothetical protein
MHTIQARTYRIPTQGKRERAETGLTVTGCNGTIRRAKASLDCNVKTSCYPQLKYLLVDTYWWIRYFIHGKSPALS